jgi:hypothetical protein
MMLVILIQTKNKFDDHEWPVGNCVFIGCSNAMSKFLAVLQIFWNAFFSSLFKKTASLQESVFEVSSKQESHLPAYNYLSLLQRKRS